MKHEVTAYIGLGSNLGDRLGYLQSAVDRLHETTGIRVTRVSRVYETAPVGVTEQPDFLNLVAELRTTLSAEAILDVLLSVERSLRRVRLVRWGPRTIDLDLLLYGEETINRPSLIVPHPRMTERAFVLVPLGELAGNHRIPGTDATVGEWIARLPAEEGIRLYEGRISLPEVKKEPDTV
jgi:2-amino-4-hydroxy-6-hydroxymethyldihydropteridine diphosphokinase